MWLKLTQPYQSKAIGDVIQVDDPIGKTLVELKHAEVAPDPVSGVAEAIISKSAQMQAEAFSKAINEALDAFAKQKQPEGHVPVVSSVPTEQKKFGDFLIAVAQKDNGFLTKHFGEDVINKTAMNSQTGVYGGYTVPTQYYPQLMQLASEMSIVRRKATIIPMGSRSVLIPTLDVTTAPTAGNSAFFGGMVAAFNEEAATLPETEPSFKQIELVAHELCGYSLASMTLLQDNAVALERLLVQLIGGCVAWHEDYNFLRGNGVGRPLGVTEANAAISISRATAGQFKLQDAAKMLSRLLPGWNVNNTCWVVSPTVLEYLIQISDSAGNVVWIPNARDPLPMTMFGIPVMVTEKLPALGTAKDVLLCDFKHYLIGDRMQLDVAASTEYRFANNQMAWRFIHRFDGQPWIRSAVTLSDASTTVSPFIYLS